jgi:hypothetical protein
MKGIILGFAVCLLWTVSLVNAREKSCHELVQESERLWLEDKLDESDELLGAALKICPNRAELYWRKARNEYVRLEAIPRDKKPDQDQDILIQRYQAVEALADKCIELDGEDGICWLFKGAALGRLVTTQGALGSLFLIDDMEAAWLKAEELKPQYRSKDGAANALGGTYYALGMFYRVAPEWLCYFPLKQIFGTCGSLEKSILYQRKAAALEPTSIAYNKELAVSLLCHGQEYGEPGEIGEAKKILKELQSYPELNPSCKIDKDHARMILEDPSLACGYQRDTQQEVSKEAYEKNE